MTILPGVCRFLYYMFGSYCLSGVWVQGLMFVAVPGRAGSVTGH